jgi:glutathione synthase/RimK-type ligase-like ATP-grasp enzyme
MEDRLSRPIAIIDEHPEWSGRLIAELQGRRIPFEKVDHSSHAYDPRDRQPRYAAVVNRSSPSSHRRGHGSVLFYAEPLLSHYESLGIPVINPVAAYRFEKSKALQVELFERLGIRYPRTVVLNNADQIVKALDGFRFPVVIKPNVGGSGAGIERFESRSELEARLPALDLGPDHTVLLQEFIEAEGGAIVRIEVLDGRFLYAIRIVRDATGFNLCPADLCQVPPTPSGGACPADAAAMLEVARHEPPPDAIAHAIALTRAASIDVGGVEYLVSREDGRIYFYDVNATSNFVANAPEVVGFDPFGPFVDYIERVAREGKASCAQSPSIGTGSTGSTSGKPKTRE